MIKPSQKKPAPKAAGKAKTGGKQATGASPLNGVVPPIETRFKPGQSGNPKGRPKDLKELRELAQAIGGENLGGTALTRIEAKLRAMSTSRNPRDSEIFLQYAYGKVKDQIEHAGADGGPIQIENLEQKSEEELNGLLAELFARIADHREAGSDSDSGGASRAADETAASDAARMGDD
jgi:hypothetical protein